MILLFTPYFIITQVIILLLFWLLSRKEKEDNYLFFLSKRQFSILLAGAMINAYLVNMDHQLFCIPVQWAKYGLFFFAAYIVGHLWLKQIFNIFLHFLMLGGVLFISCYIILFSGTDYLIWLACTTPIAYAFYHLPKNKIFDEKTVHAFLLLGITSFLPFLLIYWIYTEIKGKENKFEITLAILPICLFILGSYTTFKMKHIINEINQSSDKIEVTQGIIKRNPINAHLTELVLGVHWKYHTNICLYDGWRPTYHNPLVGFAKPFLYFGTHFHPELSLDDRKNLYSEVFPNKNMDLKCKCAKNERLFSNLEKNYSKFVSIIL